MTSTGNSHTTTGTFSQILALDYAIDGAVTERYLGTGTGQTSVPYAYDVAGRIHAIGDVTSPSDPFAALYSYTPSGLIARMDTRSGAAAQDCTYSADTCTPYWRYTFNYDALARLTGAAYRPVAHLTRNAGYTVSNITYDAQGNIETLTRNAPTTANPDGAPVDQLTYHYTQRTNRLASVADAVTTDLDWDARPTSFVYNRVGSVTWTTEELTPTTYRETEIQVYDERQLPEELRIRLIATPGGAYDSTMVSYRYDVNGQRIIKRIRETATGPDVIFERYVRDGNRLVGVFGENNELKNWNIGGAAGLVGRADPATLGYTRRFYVTDHLGSIRAVVAQAGTVIEGRDYYPYGLTMPGRFYVQADTTREGFTGHELDKETGDYYAGARYYGPALARWFVPDPMAEAYPGWSPYNYTMGNPLSLIDPDGMEADDDVDQVSAPRTTENFYPEDMFVYGMRNHPGARMPIVRVWVDGPSDQSTGATDGDPPVTTACTGVNCSKNGIGARDVAEGGRVVSYVGYGVAGLGAAGCLIGVGCPLIPVGLGIATAGSATSVFALGYDHVTGGETALIEVAGEAAGLAGGAGGRGAARMGMRAIERRTTGTVTSTIGRDSRTYHHLRRPDGRAPFASNAQVRQAQVRQGVANIIGDNVGSRSVRSLPLNSLERALPDGIRFTALPDRTRVAVP